jgi:flagellin
MALNSINTNIAAYYAQANIGKASTAAGSSISRLSSGNRVVRAADDVAAMSAGTSLRTNVTTLRRALINASQGSSLLQVADGALSQVTDILQRQKAIAVQASGGTLTGAERSFLNQEFQNLTQEIDRIATQTNFNGVQLLNGALSETVGVNNVATLADKASASITFSSNIFAGTDLVLNGTTITEGVNFDAGATLSESLDNLVTHLNGSTDVNVSKATYARQGNSLIITAKAGGTVGESFRIDSDLANSSMLSVDGTAAGARNGVINGQLDRKITAVISGIDVATLDSDATGTGVAGLLEAGAAIDFFDNTNTTTAVTVTAGDTLQDVIDNINANTGTHGVTARVGGYSGNYSIILERNYNDADETAVALIDTSAAAANVTLGTDQLQTFATLDGATDVGLGYGRNSVSGTVGNSLVTGQSQTKAKVTLSFPEIAASELLNANNFGTQRTVSIDTGTDTVEFGFVSAGSDVDTEVKIGATIEETLDNLVAAINNYQGYGSTGAVFDQIEARREGLNVIIERKDVGNVLNADGTAATIAMTGPAGSGTLGNFSNGTTAATAGGVDISGVTNAGFIGKVQGFKATYTGTNNSVNLEINVGGKVYTATSVNTNPAAKTPVRFSSQDGGGYFDVYLAANEGAAVSTQQGANTFADRLNAAFASLNFHQSRSVSSYQGNAPIIANGQVTGSLIGTSVDLKLSNFDSVKIDKIEVLAPSGSSLNGSVSITVNGEEFRSIGNIGSSLGANSVFKLVSTKDANNVLEFRTGSTAIDFSTKDKADAFQSALKTAFGVGDGSAKLTFQIGTTTADTLNVGIGNVQSSALFGGNTPDVLTQINALAASDAIDAALKVVTSVRAEVGALQSRFDFASANVESSIQNQDAARGVLLDTDVASEATLYATAQVQLQAGISVLAQANQLPQNLLKLIG